MGNDKLIMPQMKTFIAYTIRINWEIATYIMISYSKSFIQNSNLFPKFHESIKLLPIQTLNLNLAFKSNLEKPEWGSNGFKMPKPKFFVIHKISIHEFEVTKVATVFNTVCNNKKC